MRRRPVMFQNAKVNLLVMAIAAAALLLSCSAHQMGNGEQMAMAVASGPVNAAGGGDTTAVTGRNHYCSMAIDHRSARDVVDASDNRYARNVPELLGILPDSQACDGEPCSGCEFGTMAAFSIEADESLEIVSCCREDHCLTRFEFLDDKTGIAVAGPRIEPQDFSPQANRVVAAPKASSTDDDPGLYAVAVDVLRRHATSVEGDIPVVAVDELADDVHWRLSASMIHRFEGLPARAVQEAGQHCESGVHVPTLALFVDDFTPYSDEMTLVFRRWIDESNLLFSTHTDSGGQTRLHYDAQTECMRRMASPRWPESPARVEAGGGAYWIDGDAMHIKTLDSGTVVIRGEVIGAGGFTEPDWAGHRPRIHAEMRTFGEERFGTEVTVVHRHLSDAELAAFTDGDMALEQLVDERVEAPTRRVDAQWRIPVTLIAEVPDMLGEPVIDVTVASIVDDR